MAKIQLTVDKNYCSDWKVFAGVRELLQNAKDADDDGYKMTVEHFPKTERLEITTAGIYVDPAKLLILGKTDKGGGRHRGKFGEGFALGTLALVRAGFDVTFRNGEASWGVSFEEPDADHPLAGNQLLTFRSRKLAAREADFCVTVQGMPAQVWDALRPLFLFLEEPKQADIIAVEGGRILLGDAHRTQVFARGIFVNKFEDLSCGYDLTGLVLDRDRRAVNEWDLHYQLGAMWKEACRVRPDYAAPRVYDMVKASAPEGRHVKWHADEKLLKSVEEQFKREHGDDAIPVATTAEARDIEGVGGRPAMVSAALKELLGKGGLTPEAAKAALEGQVEERFTPAQLESWEREEIYRLEAMAPHLVILKFRGKASAKLVDDSKVVGVDRRLLGDRKTLLRQVATAEGLRRKEDPIDVLVKFAAGVVVKADQPEEPAVESKGGEIPF